MENILHSMADSLFVITMDMSIGSVNPSLLNLLGYQEDELLGNLLDSFLVKGSPKALLWKP